MIKFPGRLEEEPNRTSKNKKYNNWNFKTWYTDLNN